MAIPLDTIQYLAYSKAETQHPCVTICNADCEVGLHHGEILFTVGLHL